MFTFSYVFSFAARSRACYPFFKYTDCPTSKIKSDIYYCLDNDTWVKSCKLVVQLINALYKPITTVLLVSQYSTWMSEDCV